MDFNSRELPDGFIDGLGNRFYSGPNMMTLESEMAPVEACFSYSEYKNLTISNDEIEIDEEDDTGFDIDIDIGEEETVARKHRGSYRYYDNATNERLWEMVYEEGVSAYRAAKIMCIPLQTAYTRKRMWNKNVADMVNGMTYQPKKRGRKPLLTDEHKEFVQNMVRENATVTLDDILKGLKQAFDNVRARASTVYNFVTKICKLSLKRISKWALRRSSDELRKERLEWAHEYKDKLDFNSNCIFVDEAGFNISMRREYGWSAVGEKATLTVPVTRGLNISFLGAISPQGCTELKARTPVVSNKKRKLDSGKNVADIGSKGTTANHFFYFIKSVVEQVKNNPELGHLKYLILDNAAIHKRRDIQLLVASSGLELVFLPPYSPSLNAIEEF